jgi:hypothetical protein
MLTPQGRHVRTLDRNGTIGVLRLATPPAAKAAISLPKALQDNQAIRGCGEDQGLPQARRLNQ